MDIFQIRQSNTRVRCSRTLDTEASVSRPSYQKQSKTSKWVELYCTQSSICTFWVAVTKSDVFNPLVYRSSACVSRVSDKQPEPLLCIYKIRLNMRSEPRCDWLFLFPASAMSRRPDDVVARNKDCKQDEAYSACVCVSVWRGNLNPGTCAQNLPPESPRAASLFITKSPSLFPTSHTHFRHTGTGPGTPKTPQQPLSPCFPLHIRAHGF